MLTSGLPVVYTPNIKYNMLQCPYYNTLHVPWLEA